MKAVTAFARKNKETEKESVAKFYQPETGTSKATAGPEKYFCNAFLGRKF